jgi:thiamine biosynthesis protein ThiC
MPACFGNPEAWRSFGRLKRKWDDAIKTDLNEIRCESVHSIHVPQDRDACLRFCEYDVEP